MSDCMRLGLGTAQFGMPYGVAGRGAAVPEHEVRAIFDLAYERGIRIVDTAPAYGDIEERLGDYLDGRPFSVVSKIPALPLGTGPSRCADLARQSARRSRERLGERLSTLLFHRGVDLLEEGGQAAWDAVERETRDWGIRMGASCYSPAEAIAIRARREVRVVQLPGNVLDQRLLAEPVGEKLEGVEIHLRSLFLQGLLLLPREIAATRVPPAARALAAWSDWRAARGIDAMRGAIGFAKSLPGVACCVVGVDSAVQLREIDAAWHDAGPLRAPVASDDSAVIDPRQWAAPP